jgi:hypothetical protein
MYFVGRRKNRRWKELERNRNEEEEERRKLAFWITSAETQAESLSQSGKALLPILYFFHP